MRGTGALFARRPLNRASSLATPVVICDSIPNTSIHNIQIWQIMDDLTATTVVREIPALIHLEDMARIPIARDPLIDTTTSGNAFQKLQHLQKSSLIIHGR
jgi:hypothetical protein